MKALSLLAFSTVSLLYSLSFALPAQGDTSALNPVLDSQPGLKLDSGLKLKTTPKIDTKKQSQNQGQCYEIFAGKSLIGFMLSVQTKNQKNEDHIDKKTYTYFKNNAQTFEESLETISDSFYKPLSFNSSIFKNSTRTLKTRGRFKSFKGKDIVEYKIHPKGQKPKFKELEVPQGSVFHSLALELLFKKRTGLGFTPFLSFETHIFNERTGQIQNMTSQVASLSDEIQLTHQIDNESFFVTEHTQSGNLIRSMDQQQNLQTKKCLSLKKHLEVAQEKKTFNDLFTTKEQDILKSCCQL